MHNITALDDSIIISKTSATSDEFDQTAATTSPTAKEDEGYFLKTCIAIKFDHVL